MGESARVFYLALLFITGEANASENENEVNTNTPSQALLEFLADFETDDGQWVDPFELLNMVGIDTSDNASEVKDDE